MTTQPLPNRTPSTDSPTNAAQQDVTVGKISLRTGLPVWRGVVWDEYRDELRSWPTAVKRYKEMQDDAVIGAVLEAIKAPLMASSFEVQPVSDKPDDQEAAEFLRVALFEMPEMEWYEHVEEMLEMLDFGWAISEKATYKHDSGFLMPALLLPVGQETLDRWGDFDKLGNPISFFQRTPEGEILEAPMKKLLHFTWRSRKRSPLGKSVLRSVYRPYLYVKNLESIEGIGAERDVGNTPVAQLGPGMSYNDEQIKELEEGLKGLRVDETGYLIVPHGVEINPLGSGGKIWPVRQIIQQWQHLIRQRMFVDFIALGSGASGSRALATELTSMFALSLRSIQNKMLAVWNRQLIPWIFQINGITSLEKYPKLEWQKPGNKSIMAIAQSVNTLVGAGLITPDPNLEHHIREELSLPPITQEELLRIKEEAKAEQAALAAPLPEEQNQGQPGNSGRSNSSPNQKAQEGGGLSSG